MAQMKVEDIRAMSPDQMEDAILNLKKERFNLRFQRATASVTPSSSNMMRPGFTRATHSSGAPLPEPMRTSAGFFVTGTSGKMRIQTRPARFMARVIARRAASI